MSALVRLAECDFPAELNGRMEERLRAPLALGLGGGSAGRAGDGRRSALAVSVTCAVRASQVCCLRSLLPKQSLSRSSRGMPLALRAARWMSLSAPRMVRAAKAKIGRAHV